MFSRKSSDFAAYAGQIGMTELDYGSGIWVDVDARKGSLDLFGSFHARLVEGPSGKVGIVRDKASPEVKSWIRRDSLMISDGDAPPNNENPSDRLVRLALIMPRDLALAAEMRDWGVLTSDVPHRTANVTLRDHGSANISSAGRLTAELHDHGFLQAAMPNGSDLAIVSGGNSFCDISGAMDSASLCVGDPAGLRLEAEIRRGLAIGGLPHPRVHMNASPGRAGQAYKAEIGPRSFFAPHHIAGGSS